MTGQGVLGKLCRKAKYLSVEERAGKQVYTGMDRRGKKCDCHQKMPRVPVSSPACLRRRQRWRVLKHFLR